MKGNNIKNIVLFGAPGTGKGTQSSFLISQYKLCHISTGDLFRKALGNKTPLGLKAKNYMDKGHLVPDFIVIDLIKEVISDLVVVNKQEKSIYKGFILDGYPRTLLQAEALEVLLNNFNIKLNIILYLNVLESTLLNRIIGRRIATKSGQVYHVQFKPPIKEGVCDISGEKLIHRIDDQKEVVKQRLEAYNTQTAPLIKYYKDKNILIEINGEGSTKTVYSRIQKAIINNT